MKIFRVLYGIATYVPGIYDVLARIKGMAGYKGGAGSARYCYSVWLRHLVMAGKNGLDPYPKIIAELGPGNSLGVGLAALISGCEQYFAFDVVEYANPERNLKIFDELIMLFKNKTPIPGVDEFPKVKPYLDKYDFPSDILNEKRLNYALEKSRIEKIRNSITNRQCIDKIIKYIVPWNDISMLENESVDMIYSQAVLEHVDNLKETYKTMYSWLKPNGYISHQIDFKCHGTADDWNGHWTYSDFMWKITRGKRPYLLNREPHSTHIAYMVDEGFEVVCDNTIQEESRITSNQLAPRFRYISNKDIITSGVFVQGKKLCPTTRILATKEIL
jgi:hypothetical protein